MKVQSPRARLHWLAKIARDSPFLLKLRSFALALQLEVGRRATENNMVLDQLHTLSASVSQETLAVSLCLPHTGQHHAPWTVDLLLASLFSP